MLSNFRKYLSPGTVLGTVAVFVALGGGYAMAFVGSGQLQKGAANDVGPTTGSNFETIRTLDGIGSIRGGCVNDGDDQAQIQFLNTSGELMVARSFEWFAADEDEQNVSNGNGVEQFIDPSTNETIEYHIYPGDDDSDTGKAPQANIQVSVDLGANCAGFDVHVLVLNTQE